MNLPVFQDLDRRAVRVKIRELGDEVIRRGGPLTFSLRLGGFLRLFFGRTFRQIFVPTEDLSRLHHAHRDGHLVFVMQSHGSLDLLCLSEKLAQEGLSPLEMAPGPEALWLQPWLGALRSLFMQGVFLFSRRRIPHSLDDGFLRDTLDARKPMAFYLRMRRGRGWRWAREARNVAYGGRRFPMQEYLRFLLHYQAELTRPIYLALHVPLWETGAVRIRRGMIDGVFGSRLAPRFLRRAFHVLFFHRQAKLLFPDIVNLKTFMEERRHLTPQAMVKELRRHLYHAFEEVNLLTRGPRIMGSRETVDAVLNDPQILQAEAKLRAKSQIAENTSDLLDDVSAQLADPDSQDDRISRRYLSEMAALYRRTVILFFKFIVDQFLARNASGFVYAPSEIERLRKAIRKGSVVLLPNHRSHLDYILVSYILFRNQITTPYICAGDNLNFFPVGSILRRAGAYFIRRAFDESTLYPNVLNRYLRFLVRSRAVQEMFIEGGRSRTGKMRPPMLGMMSLLAKSYFRGATKDLIFVPLSISYERVPEEKSFVREMRGEQKRSERVSDLGAVWRIRNERYGRIYFTVGEPISFRDYLAKKGLHLDGAKDFQKRRATSDLAYDVASALQRETVLTPTSLLALILLSACREERGAIAFSEILSLTHALWKILNRSRKVIHDFAQFESFEEGLQRAIHLFEKSELVVWNPATQELTINRKNPGTPFLLDYYRNAALSFFLSHALVANSVLAVSGGAGGAFSRESVLEDVARLAKWLAHDFPVPSDVDPAVALGDFQAWGTLEEHGDELRVTAHRNRRRRMRQMAGALVSLVEAYSHTTAVCETWFEAKETFFSEPLEEGISEALVIRRVFSYMKGRTSPEAQNWFLVANALQHLSDEKILKIRNMRRGRKVIRTVQFTEDLADSVLRERTQGWLRYLEGYSQFSF